MADARRQQIIGAKEAFEVLQNMSKLLETGLDNEILAICLKLLEGGVNPEALASVMKNLREVPVKSETCRKEDK